MIAESIVCMTSTNLSTLQPGGLYITDIYILRSLTFTSKASHTPLDIALIVVYFYILIQV